MISERMCLKRQKGVHIYVYNERFNIMNNICLVGVNFWGKNTSKRKNCAHNKIIYISLCFIADVAKMLRSFCLALSLHISIPYASR